MVNHTQQTPLTLADLRQHRDDILDIARRNKATNVCVFGSVARGDARSESDVDFLVTFEPGASLYDLSGIVMDLQEFLGREVDVADGQSRNERFLQRVLKEALPL